MNRTENDRISSSHLSLTTEKYICAVNAVPMLTDGVPGITFFSMPRSECIRIVARSPFSVIVSLLSIRQNRYAWWKLKDGARCTQLVFSWIAFHNGSFCLSVHVLFERNVVYVCVQWARLSCWRATALTVHAIIDTNRQYIRRNGTLASLCARAQPCNFFNLFIFCREINLFVGCTEMQQMLAH